MLPRPLCVAPVLLSLGLAADLSAHGGLYRWPTTPSGPGQAAGVRSRAPSGAITGPGSVGLGHDNGWETWWEFNKDPYLRLREAVHDAGLITDEDEFFMGGGRREAGDLAPTEVQLLERVLPTLQRLLKESGDRDITTAALVAMAKLGRNNPETDMVAELAARLSRGNQEIRETAAVSLGISASREALPLLRSLALDEGEGRRLVGQGRVSERTRAFAIYGLGLLAAAGPDIEVKLVVQDTLGTVLQQGIGDSRNVIVACINAMGLLRLDPEVAEQKRLLWETVDSLQQFYRKDVGRGDELVQAHALTAMARLLGRGNTPLHRRIKQMMVAEFAVKERSNTIYQSAALGLGRMLLAGDRIDEEHCAEIYEYAEEGKDELARNFCLIALGETGGEENRERLLEKHATGNKAIVRPWAAIALGIHAYHHRLRSGKVDEGIGRALLTSLRKIKNPRTRSAHAVALGLSGYREASKEMLKMLDRYEKQDRLAGYLCIGLALMGEQRAVQPISELVRRSVRRPELLTQAAVALAKMGDKDAVIILEELFLDGTPSLARLSSLAMAFRFVGDRRAVDSLCETVFDQQLPDLSRAFLVAALGGVVDKDMLPWNAKLSIGVNYMASVSTLTNRLTGVLDIL